LELNGDDWKVSKPALLPWEGFLEELGRRLGVDKVKSKHFQLHDSYVLVPQFTDI
jgi:hypothetical protein